jgi:hypothetical protein
LSEATHTAAQLVALFVDGRSVRLEPDRRRTLRIRAFAMRSAVELEFRFEMESTTRAVS